MVAMMIGDLARRTGAKVNTIRFYEEIGLMPQAARTGAGRRTYGEPDLQRLSFIRHGRELGFSVNEIRSLIALSGDPDRDCDAAAGIARKHLATVEDRITLLEALRDELKHALSSCEGGRIAECRVIEAIAQPASPDHGRAD